MDLHVALCHTITFSSFKENCNLELIKILLIFEANLYPSGH